MVLDPVLIGAILLSAVLFGALSYVLGRRTERNAAEASGRAAEQKAKQILDEARRKAEAELQSSQLRAKEEAIQLRETVERESAERRRDLDGRERHAVERETAVDRRRSQADEREAAVQERDNALRQREAAIQAREDTVDTRRSEADELLAKRQRQLEQVSRLTVEEAKQQLMQQLQDEVKAQAAALVREIKEQARRDADREAKKIIALAMQRMASEQASEATVSAVTLPNDEMKGRIIGREGRNIRAFETATNVDVIVDDTPDTVVISCFDPMRREIARIALERLIADGRIHPGRIEEVVAKAKEEVDQSIIEAAEQATYDTQVHGLHPELMKLVGRMKYRSSYGQNLLEHTKEVVWLAGMLAAELGVDVDQAKRGALLHDIGKILTHEHEGTHVQLGVDVAKKYGENAIVVNCIEAHHDDVPHETTISVVVQAADAISGARPGARRESFESYVKRLTRLEEIAGGYDGVEKTFAIQAGREIRIMVVPDKVTDEQAVELAESVARKIEGELQYPGQIKVTVIRETRAVEVAR